MKLDKKMMVIFLTPALLSFLLVFIYPIFRTLFMSFFYVQTVTDSFLKWEFIGLDNYVMLFRSSMFMQSLHNIFYIWFYGGIAVFIVAMFFSILLTFGCR